MLVITLLSGVEVSISENNGKKLFNVIESDLSDTYFEFSLDKYDLKK